MKDEALKLALSCIKSSTEYKRGNATFVEAAEDVEQALAAPVQKRPPNCGTGYCSCIECVMEPAAQPAPVQEPVAWDRPIIYTPPHMRQWVGLTTDEMKEVADRYHLKPPNVPVAFRAIEAKLKEKNSDL
jgi:hypothetical protein